MQCSYPGAHTWWSGTVNDSYIDSKINLGPTKQNKNKKKQTNKQEEEEEEEEKEKEFDIEK